MIFLNDPYSVFLASVSFVSSRRTFLRLPIPRADYRIAERARSPITNAFNERYDYD